MPYRIVRFQDSTETTMRDAIAFIDTAKQIAMQLAYHAAITHKATAIHDKGLTVVVDHDNGSITYAIQEYVSNE